MATSRVRPHGFSNSLAGLGTMGCLRTMKWRALEISSGTVNEFGERAYGFGERIYESRERIYEFGERVYRFEDRGHGLEDRTVGVCCRTDGPVLQATPRKCISQELVCCGPASREQ